MKKKVIIPIAIIVGVAAVALGVILGLKACSKDTENETEATVIITNENGETFISTADSTVPASSGDIVTDGTDKTDAERNGNTLGSDTSDTSGTNASGTTTTTSGSGNGSGNGTSESTGGTNGTTKPTENIPPPETEEGEILIIEPTTTASGNNGSGNGGKNPTTTPAGGGSSNQPTTSPTSNGGGGSTPAPTSSEGDGVIELPFVPIEDIEGVE